MPRTDPADPRPGASSRKRPLRGESAQRGSCVGDIFGAEVAAASDGELFLFQIHHMQSTLCRICIGVGVVLISSCATPAPPAQMTLPFNSGDVAWSRAPGTATVEGGAEISTAGNRPQTCAGGEAQLLPAGAYAAEMMRIVFRSDVRGFAPLASSRYPANIAPDFGSTVRRIGCDPDGRFRFDGVPAGRWYLFSNVIFRGAGAEAGPLGGALMQRIDVAEGARVTVLLTP